MLNFNNKLKHDTVYYALGDSLTSGSYSDSQGEGHARYDAPWSYPQRIADALGIVAHNLARPGNKLSVIIANQLPNIGNDANLITIMTGTNDYTQNTVLGTYTDTDPDTSFMGQLYTLVDSIMTSYPVARLVILSPLNSAGDLSPSDKQYGYRRGVDNSAGWNYDDLVEQMKLFCNKYGIEFVDCTTNGPINTFNLLDTLKDYTHPTKESYALIGQYIYSKLF